MSWAYRVFEKNDSVGAVNAMRFATEEEAASYGSDLLFRWMAPSHGEPEETDDPVNYRWVPGKGAESLPDVFTDLP